MEETKKKTKQRGLGRGLAELLDINPEPVVEPKKQTKPTLAKEEAENEGDKTGKVVYLDIHDIKPNGNQPRKKFNEEKIDELAESIKNHGIIQPIIVRKSGKGYEIVAGERRYRAARRAELKTLPCLIRELTDEQNMLFAIIENMQREDLNAIEEADAINQMISTFGLTQEQVSKSLGKSRPYITNTIRLLKLPASIQSMVVEGELSAGHARALVTITDEKKQQEIAKRVAQEGLSVREIERLAGAVTATKKRALPRKIKKGSDVLKVEEELKDIFGTKVNLNIKGEKGKMEIEFYSRDELERMIELLRALR